MAMKSQYGRNKVNRFLIVSLLCLVSTLSYADQCPSNSVDTSFYKAFWKNEGSARGHVNCVYIFLHGKPADTVIVTQKQYDQKAIATHSGWQRVTDGNGYICLNGYQYNCAFG
jgi:hypothetical protein